MSNFLIFAGLNSNRLGGWHDFQWRGGNLGDAVDKASELIDLDFDWVQIVSQDDWSLVKEWDRIKEWDREILALKFPSKKADSL